jgi:hypothetical protein
VIQCTSAYSYASLCRILPGTLGQLAPWGSDIHGGDAGGITRRLRDVSRGSTIPRLREIHQEAEPCHLKIPGTLSQMDEVY